MSRQNIEFAEILEAQINKFSSAKSNSSTQNASEAKSPHFESTFSFEQFQLNLKTKLAEPLDIKPAFKKSPYIVYIKTPKTAQQPKVKLNHILNDLQKAAFEFLKSYDFSLSQAFDHQELKRAFRTSVLRTHPDHNGNTELFLKTQHAYQTLKKILL